MSWIVVGIGALAGGGYTALKGGDSGDYLKNMAIGGALGYGGAAAYGAYGAGAAGAAGGGAGAAGGGAGAAGGGAAASSTPSWGSILGGTESVGSGGGGMSMAQTSTYPGANAGTAVADKPFWTNFLEQGMSPSSGGQTAQTQKQAIHRTTPVQTAGDGTAEVKHTLGEYEAPKFFATWNDDTGEFEFSDDE